MKKNTYKEVTEEQIRMHIGENSEVGGSSKSWKSQTNGVSMQIVNKIMNGNRKGEHQLPAA